MSKTEHTGLPVKGYAKTQSAENVGLVDENKVLEEQVLRQFDRLFELVNDTNLDAADRPDPRWLAIAKTNIEQGFMAMNRAIFKPGRVRLTEDKD